MTEQTRDWERGERARILAGIRSYSKWAGALMLVAVPVFFVAMPWLVEVVFGDGVRRRRRPPPASSCSPPRSTSRSAGRSRCPSRSAGRGCGSSRTGSRRSSRSRSSPCSGRVGGDGRRGRRARLDARVRGRLARRDRCACATRCAARSRARCRSSREGRRRLRDLAARPRRPGEPRARARGLPRRSADTRSRS